MVTGGIVGIDVIFKIAGIGMITAVLNSILDKTDKKEISTFVTIAGLVLVLAIVIDMVGGLFGTLKSIFLLD